MTIDLPLIIRLLIFNILISFAIAKLEIQIEGKDGWAKNLPTWRIHNQITKIFWDNKPLTGYHFWFHITMLLSLHYPFFVNGQWSLKLELLLIGMFVLAIALEDVFWFILNPHFGIKKLTKKDAHWHLDWVGVVPKMYLILAAVSAIFIFASIYLS